MERDLGYYVWHLLKVEEETSLFPEFYSLFKSYSRYETIRSLSIHPKLGHAVAAVAAQYDAEASELESAFNDIITILVGAEEDDRFKLFWDFIYYFGGTRLDVPARDRFLETIQKASIYMQVVIEGGGDVAVEDVAGRYGISPEHVNRVVEYVGGVVSHFEALDV